MKKWETTDLAIAAWLLAKDYSKLVDIYGPARQKVFVFSPPPSQETLVSFYSGQDEVSARKFIDAYQNLRSSFFILPDEKSDKKKYTKSMKKDIAY